MSEMKETLGQLNLQVYPALPPRLEDEVKRFRVSVTDMSGRIRTPQEESERSERYCSDADVKRWILMTNGNDLIGMAVIFGRQIPYADQTVSFGGIGRVRVKEDWRGKGVATRMMDEAMRQLADMNNDVAFLETDIKSFLGDFYRKYGFLALGRPFKYRGLSEKEYQEDTGMLAPVRSETIFRQMMEDKEVLDIGKGKW